ncbi:UNVERIFIED_CONTAM: hypothetical protein K2H54_007892 [Gekko kuhli]
MASRDVIGPALPPGFVRSSSPDDGSQVAGPALPPDYRSNLKRRDCDQDYSSPHVPREAGSDSEDDRDASQNPRKQRRLQDDDDDGFFGPALPPGFKKQDDSPERFSAVCSASASMLILEAGPDLTLAWRKTKGRSDIFVGAGGRQCSGLSPGYISHEPESGLIGSGNKLSWSAFPQDFLQGLSENISRFRGGPSARGQPARVGFKKPSEEDEENRSSTRSSVLSLSSSQASDSSEDEESVIGPVPAKGPAESSVAADFECRAQKMKEKLLGHDNNESKQVKRESWMTELPPELKGFGLGSRTFKRRADDKSGDRSVWTDTPADRERKAKEMHDGKKSAKKGDGAAVVSERDKKLAEQVSSHNVGIAPLILS